MLLLNESLIGRPVLGLRTSQPVAQTVAVIINPNNLKIEGFYCNDSRSKDLLILLSQDIRETLPQGFVVNDHEVLSPPEELVRLKDILALRFELMNKQVVTTEKERVGKVNDFAADSSSLYIQKIYVGQNLLKSFSGGQLSIDRSQIVEITNKKIVIQPPLQLTKAGLPANVLAT